MTCERWQDKFTEYLEGTLESEARRELDAHLHECADCAADVENFRITVSALRDLEAIVPPEGLLNQINGALDAEDDAGRRRQRVWPASWSWQQVGAMAVAASLLVGFVAVFRNGLVTGDLTTPTGGTASIVRGSEMDMAPAPAAEPSSAANALAQAAPEDVSKADGVLAQGAMEVATDKVAPQPEARETAKKERPRASSTPPRTKHATRAFAPGRPASSPQAENAVDRVAVPPAPTVATEPAGGPEPARPMPTERVRPTELPAQPRVGTSLRAVAPPVAPAPSVSGMSGGRGMAGMPGATRNAPGPSAAPRSRMSYSADAEGMGMGGPGGGATKSMAPAAMGAMTEGAGRTVRINFVPPRNRLAGKTAVGAVVIEADVEVEDAVVRVAPGEGLHITNSIEPGIVYRGRLRAGQRTTIAVGMESDSPGKRTLNVKLSSAVPEANAEIPVVVEEFVASGNERERPAPRAVKDISLAFGEMPIRDALTSVGRAGGVSVKLDPAVGGKRINAHFEKVPTDAALRILCDETGYELKQDGAGYRISAP